MSIKNTAELVRLAREEERERCAAIVNGWLTIFGEHNPEHVSPQKWAADAVRDILDGINSPRTE